MTYRNRKTEQYVFNFYKSLPKKLRQFPFNISGAILTLRNCTIWSYQKFAEYHNISIDDIIGFCKSETGCTHKDGGKYVIMFNDAPDMVGERKTFTLAHELAHIQLGHFSELRDEIYGDSYFNYDLEQEANYFASCVLCPMPVLSRLEPMSSVSVRRVFGLSNEATEIALKNYDGYDKLYNVQWHNDMLGLFELQNQKINFFTYIQDIHKGKKRDREAYEHNAPRAGNMGIHINYFPGKEAERIEHQKFERLEDEWLYPESLGLS